MESTLDFSEIISQQIAQALYAQGKLEKILLFPSEFGGEDIPPNTAFVPLGISEIKQQLTVTLMGFFNEGLIDNLSVDLEYKGNSFIPSKINMRAWHTEKEGSFNPSIDVW